MEYLKRLQNVAIAIAFHVFSSVFALGGIKVVEIVYHALYPEAAHLLFGKVPLSFMFDSMDVIVVFVLIWKTTTELWNAFNETE